VGKVFFTGEKTQERAALVGSVVAYSAAQDRVQRFKLVEHRSLSNGPLNLQNNLGSSAGEGSQVVW
jgi:hypothetical protein